MSAETPDRDPVVAQALAAIEVPEHGPGFWDRLAREMGDQEDVAPSAASVFADVAELPPPTVTELELALPPQPRRARLARFGARMLAAAAAVLVVLAAGVLVARNGDDTGPNLGSDGGLGPPASTTAPPTGGTPQEQVVVDFVDALGRGDLDAAALLLGPRSEAYAEAQFGSTRAALSEAAEGFGAWSASPDRQIDVIEDAGLVVVRGTISPEGMTEHRYDAFPVVGSESAGGWFVDLWVFDHAVPLARQLIVVDPEPDAEGRLVLAPGDRLEATIGLAGTFRIWLDGIEQLRLMSGTVDSSTATWTVPDDAADGAALVILFQSDTGAVTSARAFGVYAG